MGFFREAQGVFEFEGRGPRRDAGPSDVLLEITPIRANADVHQVVDRVQGRAGAILASKLGYPASAVVQFSVILSEVCQNVIEHAEGAGWVAAQAYNWARRLGRWVVVISVMDVGRGFRGSLTDEHAARYGDRWSDATALEAAFLHGLTRFPDSGRGQGIQQIRRQVQRWNGAITIRSGSARIGQVPDWDDTPPMADGLAPFPGAQISIVLPARNGEAQT
jgi:anti-sigma regulatory factor (Ser/Thr protein kinase)